jgi:hypothetical protein
MTADGWVDAGEAAWEEDGVRVALAFATVATDPTNVRQTKAERSLWIGVRVTNVGTRTIEFAGWDATGPGGPVLTTTGGSNVGGRRFGKSAPTSLAPGKTAECVLAFDVPAAGQGVRLELPAAVYGGTTPARFQIAPELILRK